MACLAELLSAQLGQRGTVAVIAASIAFCFVLSIILNALKQLLFKNPNEPPVVFHWLPLIGSSIAYSSDPYKFFLDCQKKYGDIFTFILFGKKTTVYLGRKGNNYILDGKPEDVNAEDIYSNITTPVFGTDVVYDCPNAKFMEQKKFMKFGLTARAFRSYVPLIANEVNSFLNRSPSFKGNSGQVDIATAIAEITFYATSHCLQGEEVRTKFGLSFFTLYGHLKAGLSLINCLFSRAPLPHNHRRDVAQRKMTQAYMDIIKVRRESGEKKDSTDMIWNLMSCAYKNGTPVPDKEIAHMMIALLVAGQHSSVPTCSWVMLRLTSRPDIMEELYQEQLRVFESELRPLTFEDLAKLTLNQKVVKETLRLHAPIHSIMRAVKSPMPVVGTPYVIPTSHILLAAPGFMSRTAEYFPDPTSWEPHRWDSAAVAAKVNESQYEKEDYGYGLVTKGASSPFLPFGAGRHRCIGEQFAYVQLGTITAAIVREFKFRKVDGKEGAKYGILSSLLAQRKNCGVIGWERRNKC